MKRKLFRITIALLVLIVLPLIAWRMYLASVIDRELAKIQAAGLPINGAELNRWYPAVPDNQNAALVLTQAFALRRQYPDARSSLIHNFKLPNRGEHLSSEQIELLQGHVELNQTALGKADEALRLRTSRYPVDYTPLMNTLLPHLAWLDDIIEMHQFKAYSAMDSGDAPSAATSIVAMLALARTLDNEPCLISQLVRLKEIERAFNTLERRANTGPLSAAEIESLAAVFAQTRITNSSAVAFIGERAMMNPYFRMSRADYARLNPPQEGGEIKTDTPLPCHGSAILRLVGYYEIDYGSFLIGMSKAIALSSNAAPDNLRARSYFARVGEESTKRRRTISGHVFSSYANGFARENQALAHQRLALTALAIERFRNDNSSLPGSLDDLVPKYCDETPEDPFTGWDLEFRHADKGYVIYSIGPDRKDDGGLEKADKKQSDDKKSYDITFIVDR